MGLRGPEVGDKNSLRILVLGDSITAGFELAYEETYASQLQKMLSKHFNKPVQVINAGVRGYGTDQSYLYYKERGKNLQADIVLFLHVSNDPLNNITLHRMRRPFGKPAFQIVSENNQEQLNLIGYPTPDYTLCSEYRLDKNYQIEKIDTSINRTLCVVQMRFTDYSAFFTYIAFKIRQHPELLKKLYYAGSPEKDPKKDAENNSIKTTKDSPHEATLVKSTSVKSADALNVAQQPKQEQQIIDAIANKPAIPGNSATPDKLTTFIIKQLAQAVKGHKAHFALLTINDHSQFQIDKQALQNEGIHIINIDLSAKEGDPEHLYDFKNDAHWNKTGHKAFAERLVPELL
ncbi:MAG: hypothetical protein KAI17_23035, partial [Thiotrichaceae bacterium]|nr:hypothetical protein [Thiotrichaceae bacterium]